MKERLHEMQTNILVVTNIVCFSVLFLMVFFNTYRMIILEEEVQKLRESLEKCDPGDELEVDRLDAERLYVNRDRRSIMNEGHGRNSPEPTKSNEETILKDKYIVFKGESPPKPAGFQRYSSSNLIDLSQKGGATTTTAVDDRTKSGTVGTGYIVKKSALKSLESSQYSSNEFNAENAESEFPIIRDEEVLTRRPRIRMQTSDDTHGRSGRIKPLPSIHLSGDTSRYVYGTHQNFKGNGHLRHTQSIFVDWKPRNWVEKTGMMNHFGFNEGYLYIRQSGLYLVYAQIYYLDEHDINGYRVYKNDDTILQCTVSLHSGTRALKGNTCYTAGVEYMAEGDRISLGDILHGHYSLFEPGKSFFGVIKLGDIRARIS